MASSINTVSGNRVAGLASGMDTESIVEKMLSGTQSKIDKQTGLKQQLEWKQEMVRGIITDINTFHDKYFSFYSSANTNLLSNAFYNTMSASSSTSAIKVISAASNAAGKVNIDSISQLASACTVKSGGRVSGELKGTAIDPGLFTEDSYSFEMTLDGVRRTITFQKGNTGDAGQDLEETINNLNDSMYRAFGTAAGFQLDKDPTHPGTPSLNLTQLKWEETLNGGKGGAVPKEDGAGGYVPVDISRKLYMEDAEGKTKVLSLLGFRNEASNKLDYNTSLDSLPLATTLQGKEFAFSINGVEINGITSSSTLGDVISKINTSQAGVRVSYSSIEDKFIMESKTTGDISNISLEQTAGNLLTAMFGVKSGDSVTGSLDGVKSSGNLVSAEEINADLRDAVLGGINGGTPHIFSLNVDGKDVDIIVKREVTADSTDWIMNDLVDEINRQLEEEFGAGKIVLSLDSQDSPTRAVLSSADHLVSFNEENCNRDITSMLGFTEANTQKPDMQSALGELGFSGKITFTGTQPETPGSSVMRSVTIDFDDPAVKGQTVEWLVNQVQSAAGVDISFENGSVRITSAGSVTGEGDGKKLLETLFGTDTLTFGTAGAAADVTEGKNAKLSVNGKTVERNTNSFEIEGITLELTDTSSGPITLTTNKDTDKIVEGFKSFVEDYNKLIEQLNDRISESATYKKYAPLTEEQRKAMSDREVELWEEKAKEGLLRNDSNISSFLSDMRTALYQSVDGAGLALYDMGIETSDSWRDNGKLILDESKLKAAVSTNLEGVQKLMTDKEKGIGVLLDTAVKAAANVSTGSPGSLVSYAGTKAVLTTDNSLYQQLKNVSNTLSNLNIRYEAERTRYWNQFTAMEQAISNLNNQSSWLTQQFSSGG